MTKFDRKKLLKKFVEQKNCGVYEHPMGYMLKGNKPTIAIFNADGDLDHYREAGVEVKLKKQDRARIDEILQRINS